MCDPSLRTVNTDAKCGADDDWYETSPWRYPGSAGIFDSCGMAGGRTQPGGYGAVYTNTTNARQGDLGSKTLKPRPTGIAWQPGSIVQVAWAIQANQLVFWGRGVFFVLVIDWHSHPPFATAFQWRRVPVSAVSGIGAAD